MRTIVLIPFEPAP